MGIVIVFAAFIYALLAMLLTWFFARKQKKILNKIVVSSSCILIAILIPTWDIPIIKWKFNQLCKNEAGIHVYEQVVLPPKYWNKDGTLKYPSKSDFADVIPGDFEIVNIHAVDWTPITRIKKTRDQIKRKQDQKILGEAVTIWRGPNWLFQSAISMGGTEFCPKLAIPYRNIAKAVFKQQSN